MTIEELLCALNQHAEERALPLVSKRTLQDWIQTRLIPNATGRGKGRGRGIDWRYGDDALLQGRALIELKEFGRLRFERARVCLWVKGFQISADEAHQSLAHEFDLLVKRLLRASRIDYDARTGRVLTHAEAQAHTKRLGPLDPQVRASGFVVDDELLMKLASEFVFGGDKREHRGSPSALLDMLRHIGASGLFGDAEEVARSGVETLKSVQPSDLELARATFKCVERMLGDILGILISDQNDTITTALEKVRLSLSHPDWIVCFVSIFAILEHKSKIVSELRDALGWLCAR